MSSPGDLYLDPIDEMPDAVWYVRPPSGGQFGPAAGQIMRTWIAQGRVPGDALVWRAGWPQWQSAGTVFPNLGAHLAPPVVGASLEPGPPQASSLASDGRPEQWTVKPHLPGPEPNNRVLDVMLRTRMRRSQSQQMLIIASAVLVVIAFVLAIVLINVLQ